MFYITYYEPSTLYNFFRYLNEKSLLRHAFKDILPPELLYRKKSPYPKTYNPNYEWLKEYKPEIIL